MISEQELLQKWRSLPQDKQEELLNFLDFLHLKTTAKKPPLGERLRQIRSRIVASGKPLLNADEIEQELATRRGGIQGSEE
ncbi:hypothetical protein B6N60_01594 [Richelia sinica FACHB-800]|uniref:DUF2281 domain-containing protein n=1 Tax=Richelia sinica FACHB-800 TaxID=1357546 RepID=A0A975T7I5_9NOST|nr:DUF2281 domain-containing protein [Richelia sinica]MBD2663544.1 DUF2281 domain-containing protein [Richelia sinica FACHB-800]QXE22907.1 hypothetical protein B6N60_01594 [Richelia sinica FACHB-800]